MSTYLLGLATLPIIFGLWRGAIWLFSPGWPVSTRKTSECRLCGQRWWLPLGLYRFMLHVRYKDLDAPVTWPMALHLRLNRRCLAKSYRGYKSGTLHHRVNGRYRGPYRLPVEPLDVPGHQVGSTRLIGGLPPSALW